MTVDEATFDLVQRAVGDRFRLDAVPPGFPAANSPWHLFPATETATGRKVAVKAFPTEGSGDSLIGVRFEKEVGSIESAPGWLGQPHLDHPRILPILARSGQGIIYSLAMVAFEMLAGRRPFLGNPLQATFAKLGGDAPALTSVQRDASPALSDVLQRALSQDPATRFADANELRAALRSVSE